MSAATARLLAAFESLPTEEKQAGAPELVRRLRPRDAGLREDGPVAPAGDGLAAAMEQGEREAR